MQTGANLNLCQMIEHALNVLNLHIIWKARDLTSAADPSPEEIQHRESLKEQREYLLEKLVEYAIGTQSNTAEGVKRTVSSLIIPHIVDLTGSFAGFSNAYGHSRLVLSDRDRGSRRSAVSYCLTSTKP